MNKRNPNLLMIRNFCFMKKLPLFYDEENKSRVLFIDEKENPLFIDEKPNSRFIDRKTFVY